MATRPVSLTTFATLTGPITEPVSVLDTNLANLQLAVDDPLISSNVGTDNGGVNALVATITPGPAVLDATQQGLTVTLKLANTNTGAATLNLNGFGAVAITYSGGAALSGGELVIGQPSVFIWSGSSSRWILLNPAQAPVATGQNLQVFTTLTPVVASAGGAGNQIVTGTVKTVAGSLTFIKIAHGLRDGEAVQIATSGTLPTGVVAATTYIVALIDASNFGLYTVPGGWTQQSPLLTGPSGGGLTWGNPIAFTNAGTGNQTVTFGWRAPPGVTRTLSVVVGGGGGGGFSSSGTISGGGGGGGGGAKGAQTHVPGTFYPVVVGAGGAGGTSTTGVAGGNSSFSSFTGVGGSGGFAGGGPGYGGAGGAGTSFSGNAGNPASTVNTGGPISGGGAGGGSIYAGGGLGGSSAGNGGAGVFGGGGGGGGAANGNGGAGGNGLVEINW